MQYIYKGMKKDLKSQHRLVLQNVTEELKKWRFVGKNGVKMLTLR